MTTLLDRDQTNILRGVSALIIVVFHVFLAWNFPRVFNLAGSVAVSVFLFLSGYGINESYKYGGLNQYWRKKFRRIILPYFVFISVVSVFSAEFSWKAFVLDVCFINSSFWFIAYLVRWYLIYWLVMKFMPSWRFPLFIVAGLIFLNVFQQIEAEQSFSFVCGVWASDSIERLRQWSTARCVKVALGCFLLGFVFLMLKEIPAVHAYKGTLVYNYILLFIKLPMAVFIIVTPLLLPCMMKSRILYLCGITSLEVYLVHLALLDLVHHGALFTLLFVVLTVAGTYVFYLFNQKLVPRIC